MTHVLFTHYIDNHYDGILVWVASQHSKHIHLYDIRDTHYEHVLNQIITQKPLHTLEQFIYIMRHIKRIENRIMNARTITQIWSKDTNSKTFLLTEEQADNRSVFRIFEQLPNEAPHHYRLKYPYINLHRQAYKQPSGAIKRLTAQANDAETPFKEKPLHDLQNHHAYEKNLFD